MIKLDQIKQVISELRFILNSSQKKRMFFLLCIVSISSFLELLGVSAVLPFVQAVVSPELLMENEYIARIARIFGLNNSTDLLLLMGISLIMLYVVKNAFMIFSYFVQYSVSSRILMELSNGMLKAYLIHPYEFFLNINSSEVIYGCREDVDGVYYTINCLVQIFCDFLSMGVILIFLIYEDPVIAIGVILVVVIAISGMIGLLKPKIKKIGDELRHLNKLKSKVLLQTVSGIKDIYVMQRRELFEKEYESVSDQSRKLNRLNGTISNSPDRITEAVCVSGIIGLVCFRIAFSDGDTLETFIPILASFAIAGFKIFPMVGKITGRVNTIAYYRQCLRNVYSNIKEIRSENTYSSEETGLVEKDFFFNDLIEVQNVFWRYIGQEKNVLNNVNLRIYKGMSVGFIGPSGAGKTTLSDIVLGLLKPIKGEVLMDGVNIAKIPQQWAKIVGYVPQSVFLLDDTVKSNIIFGLDESEICENDIWEALEKAQIADFIRSLPDGLDTIVGERGVKFSGGQRQRIAIARALFNKPEVLVLDEATAALDNDTENALMEAIEMLQGKVTLIIVAHRLTTVRKCDIIYEVSDGTVKIRDKDTLFV